MWTGLLSFALLFAISIEPVAQLIRDNNNIKGFDINKEQQSFYRDSVLLCLTESATAKET